MMFRFGKKDAEWIDLENPIGDEVREIAHTLGFGGRIVEELISPTPFPKVLRQDDAILLVLHIPMRSGKDGAPALQEVDFVVHKHFVLTVRYEVVAPLHELRKVLEASALTNNKHVTETAALLEVLLNHLFAGVRDYATHTGKRLEYIERDMFSGRERITIEQISEINRIFLHLEASIAAHEASLLLFLHELEDRSLFGPDFTRRTHRILNERNETRHLVETLRAVAAEVRETNAALLNARQNEIMKTLTIMAFTTFPLSLIASIFGMNTDYLPIVGTPGDFWIVMGIMIALTASFFVYFRAKHWI